MSKNTKKKYADKLPDPRWQKTRLRIFERDAYQCQMCECRTKSLQVHHLLYAGKDPWDTHDDYLLTVCSDCHDRLYRLKDLIKAAVTPNHSGAFLLQCLCEELDEISKHYKATGVTLNEPLRFSSKTAQTSAINSLKIWRIGFEAGLRCEPEQE